MTETRYTAGSKQHREAYKFGQFMSGSPADDVVLEGCETRQQAVRELQEGFQYYTESAQYANTVLPELRRIAGFEDQTGAGTYTAGSESDRHVLNELVDEFREGYIDKQLATWESE